MRAIGTELGRKGLSLQRTEGVDIAVVADVNVIDEERIILALGNGGRRTPCVVLDVEAIAYVRGCVE